MNASSQKKIMLLDVSFSLWLLLLNLRFMEKNSDKKHSIRLSEMSSRELRGCFGSSELCEGSLYLGGLICLTLVYVCVAEPFCTQTDVVNMKVGRSMP